MPSFSKPLEDGTNTSPMKAIRTYCIGCTGTSGEVRKCESKECPLWHFRFGTNPFCKRGSKSANEKRSEAMKKKWESKKGKV